MGKLVAGFILGLVIVPLCAAAYVFSGHFPFEATATPPRWERRIANMALDPAVEKKADGLTSTVGTGDDELLEGMKIYRDKCAICHGDAGKPSDWGRHDFYPPAPQLADRGDHDPLPEVFVVVKHGIRYTAMGGWQGQLSDDDVWRVSQFLTRIKSLPPAVAAEWKRPQ